MPTTREVELQRVQPGEEIKADAQWAALPVAERNKYLMRGVPK